LAHDMIDRGATGASHQEKMLADARQLTKIAIIGNLLRQLNLIEQASYGTHI
jgi:hypothetical protein